MARRSGPHTIQCYHCRNRFEVGGLTQSTACPKCHRAVIVNDVIVKNLYGPLKEIRTCGKIEVRKRGRVIAEFIEAHEGIDCTGVIDARKVISGAPVMLGARCKFKGDLEAPELEIKKGAQINGGKFAVPHDPLGLADLHRED